MSRARGRRRGHEGQHCSSLLCSAGGCSVPAVPLLQWRMAVARMHGHWRLAPCACTVRTSAQPRCTPAWSRGSPFTKKGSPTTVPCGRGTKAGEREKKTPCIYIYSSLFVVPNLPYSYGQREAWPLVTNSESRGTLRWAGQLERSLNSEHSQVRRPRGCCAAAVHGSTLIVGTVSVEKNKQRIK